MRGGREKPFIVYESLLKRGSGSKRYFRQIGKLGLAPEIHAQRDMSDVKSTRYGREFIRRGALVQCFALVFTSLSPSSWCGQRPRQPERERRRLRVSR